VAVTAPLFTFDTATRAITALSSGERWVVCEHLSGPLDALLDQPAAIVAVSAGAWTRTDLSIRLSRGPALAPKAPAFLTPPGVAAWSNDDSHYDVEFGIACRACRQAISWPQ
jgi:hypothetical protein